MFSKHFSLIDKYHLQIIDAKLEPELPISCQDVPMYKPSSIDDFNKAFKSSTAIRNKNGENSLLDAKSLQTHL